MSSIIPDIELPIIQVDDAHWQKVNPDGGEALEYSISNRDGFRLSTQGYCFFIPNNADYSSPNIIQIIQAKDQLFATAYEIDSTLYSITSENLVPMYGSKRFSGFQKGQKLIVAIGHLSPPRKDFPQPKFTVLWAGVINIQ